MSHPAARTARVARSRGARLLATALGLALAATACGSSATPTPAPTAAPPATPTPAPTATPSTSATPSAPATADPSADAAIYREIEDQVIAERGLPAKERLEPIVLTPDEASRWLAEEYRKENSPEEIAATEGTLKALGLLPADASLADLQDRLRGAQVVGFYDPDSGELYVVQRSGGIGGIERSTYAHEFTHALQDQSFDTDRLELDAEGQSDRSLARLALVEGDASLAMTLWMSENLAPAELQEMLRAATEAQEQLAGIPAVLIDTLMFPYEQGLVFVNRHWMDGGWEAVDGLYDRLPDSTEQVLHPDKFEAGEKPVPVALDGGALAGALGASWAATPEDTLGEYQLSAWLRENGVKALPARDAAAGWGGDRLAYLQGPGGAYALAISTAWDTADDAREFLAAATTAAGGVPGEARVERDGASGVLVFVASDAVTLDRLAQAARGSASGG